MGKNVNIDFEKEYNKAHEDGSSKAWEHFYKITENVPNRDFLVEQERNKKEEMAKQKRKAQEQKKRDETNKQEIINERTKYSAAFPLQELEDMNAKIIKAGEEARATHLKKSNATDTELITERDKILSPINKYTEELTVVRDMMKNILNASNMFPATSRDLGRGYYNLNNALNNAKKKGTGLNPDAIQGLYDNASHFMTNLKLILSNKTNEIMFEPNKKSTIKDEEQYKKEIDNVLNLLPSRDITEEIKKMWETLDVFNQASANKKKESEQVRQSAELEKAKELNEKILNSMIQAIDSLKKIKNIDIKDEKIEEIGDLANSGDYKKALSLAQDIKKMAMAAIDEQKKTESKQETAKPKSDKKQTKQEQKPKSNKKQTKKKDQHSENFYSDLKKERDEATAKLIECYKEIRRLEQEYCSSNMTDEEYDEETDKVLLEINKLEKMISNKTAFMYEELDNAVTKLKESQSKLANSKTDKSKKKHSEDIETAKKEIEDVFNNKLSKILNSDELNFLKTITSAYVKPDVKKVDVDNYNYNTVGGQYQAVISNYSQGAHANYVSALQLELDYIKQLQITDKLTNFSIEKLKSDVKKIKKLTKKKYSTTDLDERNKISVQIREARGELKKRLERLSKLAPEIKDLVNYVIHEHTKTYNENINPENLKDYQAAIKKAEDEYNTVISYLDGSDLTISEDLKERARLWSEQPKEEQEPDYSNLPTKTNRKVEYESAKKNRESELSSERYISVDKISQNNPQAIIKNFEKNNKGWISGGETDTTATDLSSMINTLRGAKSADIEDVKTQITKKISEIRESIKAGDYEYKKYDTMERNGIIGQFETNMNPIELERFKEQVLENLQQYQDYVNDYSENVQRNEKIQEVLEANPFDKAFFDTVSETDKDPIGKMVSYIINEVEALYNDKDNRLSDNPKTIQQIFHEWQEKMQFGQSRFLNALNQDDIDTVYTELYKYFGVGLDNTMNSGDAKTYIDPKNQNNVAYKFKPSKNQNTKYTAIAKKVGMSIDGSDREYKIFNSPLSTTPTEFQSRIRRLKDSDLEVIAEDFVNTLREMKNKDIEVKFNKYNVKDEKGNLTPLAYFGIKSDELTGLDEDIDTRKKGYYTAGDLGRIYKKGDIYVQKRIEQVIKKIIKKYKLYNENPSSNSVIDEKTLRKLGDIEDYKNVKDFLDKKGESPEGVKDIESMFYDMFLSTLRNNIEYINPDVSANMMSSLGKLNGRLSTKGEMAKLEYEAGDANANKSGDDITPDLIEPEIWDKLDDEAVAKHMLNRTDNLFEILNNPDQISRINPRIEDLANDKNLSITGKSKKMYDLMYSLNRTMSAGTYAKESMKKYFKDNNLFGEDDRNYDFLQFFGKKGERIKRIFTISDRYQDFLKNGREEDPYAKDFLIGLLKDEEEELGLNMKEKYTIVRNLQYAKRMENMAAGLSKHTAEDGRNYRTVVDNMLDTLLMNENEEHTEVSERTGKEYTSLPNAEVSQMAKDGFKLVSAYKDYMINPLNTTSMYGDISYWRDSGFLELWNTSEEDRKKLIVTEMKMRLQDYIDAVQAYNEDDQDEQQQILYNPNGINYGEIDIANRIQQYSKLYPDLISKINLANPTVVYGGDEKLHVAPDYLQNNNGVDIFNGLVQDGTINTSGMSLAQANVYKSLLEKKRQMHISSLIVQKLKNKHIIKNKMTMAKGQNLNAISKKKDMFIGNRIKKSVTNEAYTKNIEEALKKKKVSKAIYWDTVARFNKSGKIFDYKLSDDEKNIRKQLTDYVNKPRIRTAKYVDEDNRTKTSTYLKLANQDEMNMRELVDLYPKLTDEYKSELFESIQNAYESFNEKDKTTFFDSLSFLSRYMPDDLLMDFARMNGQDERLQDFFQPVLDYNSTFEGNDKPYTGIKLSRSGTYYGISGLAKQYAKMSENDRQSAINDLGIIYNNSQTPEDKQKFLHALSQNYAQSDVGTEMYDTFFDSIRGDSEADTFLSNFFKPEVDLNHQWDDINYQGVGVRLPGSNIFLGPTGLNARYKAKDITTDSLQEYLKDIAEVNVSKYRGKNHLSYKLQDVAASKDGMSMTNLRNQYSKADKKGRQAIENLVEKLTYILPNGYVPGEGSELNDLIYSSLKAIVYDKDAPDNIKYDKDNALSNLVEAKFKTPKDADYADSVSNENIGEKNEDILNIVREALSSITNDEDKEKFIKSFKGSELIRDALLSNKVGSYYPDLKAIDNGGIVTDIKEIAKDYVNHKLNGEDESLNDLLKTINEVQNSISDDTLKENFINEINSAIENINNQRGLSGSSKIANTLTDELKGFASNNKMVKQPNQQLLLPEAKKKRTKAPKEDIQLAPILLPESKIEDIKSESTTSLPTQADVIEETTKSDIIIAEELPKQIVVEETAFDDLNKVVSIQHVDSMKEAIDAEQKKIEKSQELVEQLYNEKQAFDHLNDSIREHAETPNVTMGKVSPIMPIANVSGTENNNIGGKPSSSSPIPITGMPTNYGFYQVNGQDLMVDYDAVLEQKGIRQITKDDVLNAEGLGSNYKKAEDAMTVSEYVSRISSYKNPQKTIEQQINEQIAAQIMEGKNEITTEKRDGARTTHKISSIAEYSELTEGHKMNGIMATLTSQVRGDLVHAALEYLQKNSDVKVENIGTDKGFRNEINKANKRYKRIYGKDADISELNWTKIVKEMYSMYHDEKNGGILQQLAEFPLAMNIGGQQIIGRLDSVLIDKIGGKVYPVDNKTTGGVHAEDQGNQLSIYDILLGANKETLKEKLPIEDDSQIDSLMAQMFGQIINTTANGDTYKLSFTREGDFAEFIAKNLNKAIADREIAKETAPFKVTLEDAIWAENEGYDMYENDTLKSVHKLLQNPQNIYDFDKLMEEINKNGEVLTKGSAIKDANNTTTQSYTAEVNGEILRAIVKFNDSGKKVIDRSFERDYKDPIKSLDSSIQEYSKLVKEMANATTPQYRKLLGERYGELTGSITDKIGVLSKNKNKEISDKAKYKSVEFAELQQTSKNEIIDNLFSNRDKLLKSRNAYQLEGNETELSRTNADLNKIDALLKFLGKQFGMDKDITSRKTSSTKAINDQFREEQIEKINKLLEKRVALKSEVEKLSKKENKTAEEEYLLKTKTEKLNENIVATEQAKSVLTDKQKIDINGKIREAEIQATEIANSKQAEIEYEKNKKLQDEINKLFKERLSILENIIKIETDTNRTDEEKAKRIKEQDKSLSKIDNQLKDSKYASKSDDIKARQIEQDTQVNEDIESIKQSQQDTDARAKAMREYLRLLKEVHEREIELQNLREKVNKGGFSQRGNFKEYSEKAREFEQRQAELGAFQADTRNGQINYNGQTYTMTDDERKRFAEKVDDENYKFQRLNAKNQQSKVGFFAKTMDEIKNQALYHLQSGFSYQITGVIRQAFSTAIEQIKVFDAAMVNLQVVTGKNRTEIKGMIKDYSNLASELGSTTQEVIASANEFLRMGYDVDSTNELIKQSMILSKVGMIDAAQSSEYLTAAIKGYKLEVSDASKVIDMATSLDMKYAVSAGYIFEALSRTANSARLAKVSMEELQAMIAVTGEVTQRESSVIGEGFKTAFARYGNLKKNVAVGTDMSGLEGENSDELEKVNDIEAVLNKYGIRMRESDNKTWRSYSAILKDVGTQWSKYSDYEKNAISTAMYGTRQREIGLTTLENYNRVLSATEIATYSNGSAAQKFQAYLEGIEATTKNVTVAWEKFVQSIGGSTVFKFVNKNLITLIENLRTLILVGGSVALFGNLDKILIALGGMTNTVGTKINTIKDIGKMLGDGGFSKIGGNLKKKWNDVQAEVKEDSVAKQTLNSMKDTNSFVQKIYNLLVDKKTEEKQPTKIESETETDVENKETAQNAQETAQNGEQQPQSNFKRNLGASIGTIGGAMGGSSILGLVDEKLGGNGQLGSTIGGVVGSLAGLLPTPAAIGIGVAGIVTSVGIGIYKHIREEQKKDNIEKAQKSQQDFISAIQQKDNLTKYEQLSKGVSNTGQNVSLSDEDYQEFLTMGNQLAEVFPQYIQSIDDSGNAFIGLNGKIGNCSEEIVAFINTLKKQAAEKAIGNNDAYKLTAGEENIAKAKKNEESIQRAEYSLRNFDKDEDISAAHYIGEENIKEFKKKVKAEGLEKSFKMYRNAFSITNTDDYEKVVAFAKKYMGQKVLDMQQQSGKANVLQNVLPDFMNAYLPTDITEEEKGKIYDLLKGVSPDKLTDNVFLTNWFKNYKSYGLESLNPIQNTDEFSTSYVDYKKTIDETIKELVLRNKDNLTFKQGLGLSDTDELTVDILKEKLGYNITDNIDSTMLDLFGSKSRPAIFASDFSKGITVNQARKINNLSESDISQIKENAQNNQTDIESEIFKFLNDYANSTVDDYFKEVVAGVKKLNPNKNLTNEDIKKIVSEYQKVGDISGEFDKNTKSAMDNLISLSKTLNINLDTMLDNINLLNDVDKMGRTTTKMSDIESLYNQYKNIKNDMGQNGGMLSTEGYELFEKNSFGKIMDAAINGTLNSGTLNSIMKGSLNIIEKKFDAKILNDVLDSSDFYKKQKDQLSKPILMGLKGKDYTVGTDISTVNELISISAGFGKSHNLANGESAVAIGDITDDNYGSILSSMKEYFIQNGQAITTNAELYKTIVNTFGNTDSKNLIIADDSQTENIAKQILSQLANDIDSYKDILGPAAESIVKTIRTHMYDPANQQKISDAWAFYDYQQAEYDFNTQKNNYAKQKKRNPRQQAKLEKQAREIDKQERLNELEDFLQRRNLIIEQYNNKIENMDWAKSILSDFDFDGKMEYTYKGMEQNLSKINELKKQFQEVQALDVQSAEEAQKKAEALKNIGQQIKDSTNNFLELEKNLKQLAIDETNTAISDSFELINKQMDILNKAANNTDINKSLISSSAATSVIDLNLDTSKEKENEITERRNLAEALLQEQETYQNAYVESQGEYLDKLKEQNRENIAEQRADLAEQMEDLKQQQEEAERNYQNTYTQWIKNKYAQMTQYPEFGIQMTADEYNRLAEIMGKTGAYVPGLAFDESKNVYIAPTGKKEPDQNNGESYQPPRVSTSFEDFYKNKDKDTKSDTTNTAETTLVDGISEIDSKKVANNDKVKAKVKDVVDTCMGMMQDQITTTLNDENSNISIMSNLFSISEKDQTLLADKFKELAQLVSTTYVTELQNSLNAVTDHDKAVEGANKRREKDGVSDENGEQGQPNKNNLIVQQLVDSIDVDKLSEQILENLKLTMQKVKDEWENAVKTDEQYQLSAILLLSSEWSAESGETLLSNNMYSAITLALTTAISKYVTFINSPENKLPAPMLSEDWGASGLGQRMLSKIQEAYSLVLDYASSIEINAPQINQGSLDSLMGDMQNIQGLSEGFSGGNSSSIVSAGMKYMGKPYVRGGESMSEGGYDCSGFVYNALKDAGYNVGRGTAQDYYNKGASVSKNNLQEGDLVFYGKNGKATHVGIYMGDGKVLQSSGGSSNTKSNPGKGVNIKSLDSRSDYLGARRYYEGTDYHNGGMALVGDENLEKNPSQPSPETVIYPNGKMIIVGKNGPEFMNLPKGTEVLTTDETNELLKNTPHYANGTNLGDMDVTQMPKLSTDQISNIIGKYFSKSTVISPSDAQGIYNAQQQTGMSALAILSIGALESGYGTSNIAKKKNNIWGWGATNKNAYANAKTFSQMSEGALQFAQSYMATYYDKYGAKSINSAGTGSNPSGKGYAYNNNGSINSSWATSVSSIMNKFLNNANSNGSGYTAEGVSVSIGNVNCIQPEGPGATHGVDKSVGAYGTDKLNKDTLNMDTANKIMEASKAWSDAVDKMVDALVKSDLGYWLRRNEYKRNSIMDWEKNIYNNSEKDFFDVVGFNAKRSIYLKEDIPTKNFGMIKSLEKTVQDLRVLFEKETDVAIKTAMGDQITNLLSKIDEFTEEINTAVNDMIASANQSAEQRQQKYEYDKGIADSRIGFGFVQKTGEYFRQNIENLKAVRAERESALSEIKRVLYDQYKKSGKYTEEQIESLIENNSAVREATNAINEVDNTIKSERIGAYDNAISVTERRNAMNESRYGTWADSDSKLTYRKEFLDENNNSIKLLERAALLRTKLMDPNSLLSVDEKEQAVTEYNNTIHEFWNGLSENLEKVQNINIQNSKNKDTAITDSASIGRIDTYNKKYSEDRLGLANNRVNEINQKIRNEQAILGYEAQQMGYAVGSKKYKEYIENSETMIRLKSEEVEANQEINSILEERLKISNEQIDNDQTLLDLRKEDEWNSISNIESYYERTENNLQKKRSELVHYMEIAKLSREDYEAKRMELAQLDKEIADTRLNALKEKQEYYKTAYNSMTYMVNEYTNALSDEKDNVSERYDKEIRKLEKVNDAKERSIKLTELQNNLENAKKGKKRVYRAGVGFVYEDDRESISKAEKDLDDFYRSDRISSLQKAQEMETRILDERIKAWNKYLKAVEKVYNTAERRDHMSNFNKMFGTEGWNGIWNLLDSDMGEYLTQADKGDKIYFGEMTDMLDKYIGGSSEIYQLVHSIKDILVDAPIFNKTDGLDVSQLRPDGIIPKLLTNINSIQSDEFIRLNKERAESYDWKNFTYKKDGKGEDIHISDYSEVLGDNGSNILESIAKTYGISVLEAKAIVTNLQEQKNKELKTNFTGTGKYANVDIMSIIQGGVIPKALLAEGYSLKDLKDARDIKIDQLMATTADADKKAEYQKMREQMIDGTNSPVTNLEELFKNNPTMSVSDVKDFVENNRVNMGNLLPSGEIKDFENFLFTNKKMFDFYGNMSSKDFVTLATMGGKDAEFIEKWAPVLENIFSAADALEQNADKDSIQGVVLDTLNALGPDVLKEYMSKYGDTVIDNAKSNADYSNNVLTKDDYKEIYDKQNERINEVYSKYNLNPDEGYNGILNYMESNNLSEINGVSAEVIKSFLKDKVYTMFEKGELNQYDANGTLDTKATKAYMNKLLRIKNVGEPTTLEKNNVFSYIKDFVTQPFSTYKVTENGNGIDTVKKPKIESTIADVLGTLGANIIPNQTNYWVVKSGSDIVSLMNNVRGMNNITNG